MSIVGTRPPLISETNLYEPHHKAKKRLLHCEYAIKLINGNGKKMDEETISLATLRAYLWYAADMDIFLQSIALSASHVPFIKEAKKEKQIIQDKDMKALLAVPPDTQKGNRDQNKRGLSP